VRAAPAVSCARYTKENAHEHTGSAEAIRHSLRDGFTAYFALSPVTGLSCHRHRRNYFRQLDASVGASGPHDFTVRVGAARLASPKRPPHPAPTFVTTRTPLLRDGMRGKMPVIWGCDQRCGLRQIGTTGNLRMAVMCDLPAGQDQRARGEAASRIRQYGFAHAATALAAPPKEHPTPTIQMPSTSEELMALKAKVAAERKAKRDARRSQLTGGAS
jgi:hypothetical protein